MNDVILREQSFAALRKSWKLTTNRIFRNVSFPPIDMAGYSGTPLIKKLGIKAGTTATVINPPAHYAKLLGPLPQRANLVAQLSRDCGFAHVFITDNVELKKILIRLRKAILDDGVAWISWPKKSSRVQTNVTEDLIRDLALPLGFVDTKVCAVDETWSGLKLMIRRENRKSSVRK